VIDRKLRVGTWNILGRQRHHDSRVADDGAVYDTLADTRTDILCLQEVHFYDGEVEAQLRSELRAAGLSYFVGAPLSPSHLDEEAQLGVGIAARFPLQRPSTRALSNPGLRANVRGQEWELHDKGLIGTQVRLSPGVQFNVYSLHLFPFFEFGADDRADHVDKMWRELWDVVDGHNEHLPTILAGDYNRADRADAAAEFSRVGWNFCASGVPTTATGLSLDDIALNWAPGTCTRQVIQTFSDHHLVLAEIDMSRPPCAGDQVVRENRDAIMPIMSTPSRLSDVGGAPRHR